MGNPEIVHAYIPNTDQHVNQYTREIWDGKWNRAKYIGQKKDKNTPVVFDDSMVTPDGYSGNTELTKILKQRYTYQWVSAYSNKESTIVQFDGKEFFVELCINNTVLGENPVWVVTDFYRAAVGNLKSRERVLASTESAIENLSNETAAA